MGSKEVKIEKHLSTEDTGSFLCTLADILTGRSHGEDSSPGIDLQDFKKIKMDLRKEGELLSLKLKVKYSSPVLESGAEDTGAPMKYKSLKKQIKSTFKTIKASIEGGSLPGADVVETFMQQAELMVSYTARGYGDEYYDEFMNLCRKFRQVFEDGDLDKLVTAYNALDARKALCHDKYD